MEVKETGILFTITGVSPTPQEASSRPITPDGRALDTHNIEKIDTRIQNHKKRRLFGGLRPFAGIRADITSRMPYYWSDWKDAWNYRVFPATAIIFFANVLPGIAFSLDLIETTGKYGVVEILMASFVASALFSIFAAQPLVIVGVTGPITVLNKTIYDILKEKSNPPDYLQFIAWVYVWSALMQCIFTIFNGSNFVRYITRFSCETFGFFVAWVYIQYGVQMVTRQFASTSLEAAYVSLILALMVFISGSFINLVSRAPHFHRHMRRFLSDYGMPIIVIAISGCAYWGRFHSSTPATLPVGRAFEAANGRPWLVKFWELDAKWIAIALPFGFALFLLFAFDHQVSALIAQGSEFPLRKPPGFHYDFLLLGLMTFVSGLIGVPAPNGLIPQAPIHTRSLVVMGRGKKLSDTALNADQERTTNLPGIEITTPAHNEPISVVEQRLSNLAQGILSLILLTGPFLHILGLIPRGVLAGLFWLMGIDALTGNNITSQLLFLVQDRSLTPQSHPLHRVRSSRIWLFVFLELIGFGITMAIVQTRAAIGFPVIIMLLVPFRTFIVPKLPFTDEELQLLDSPTASAFTMESVGGPYFVKNSRPAPWLERV